MIDAEMIAQINALGRESRAHNQALAVLQAGYDRQLQRPAVPGA